MTLRARFVASVFALALVLAGCESPTETRCDICTLWVRVAGTVEAESGAPVAGVTVETVPFYGDPCSASRDSALELQSTTTNGQGEFEQFVEATSILGPSCVTVRIEPSGEAGLAGAVDTFPADFVRTDESPNTVSATFVLEAP